jgi:cytoskeletal protein RodZ
MTRTDVMASSRPRTPGAARKTRRKLVSLPILLLTALALVVPGSALAAEGTSGYNQEPPKPTTTTETTPTPQTTTTTPSTGTSPSKEEGPAATTPTKETTPTSSSSPAKEEAKTLPFTGFDLRWSFAIGLALMIAGFSIVGMQRRRRSDH